MLYSKDKKCVLFRDTDKKYTPLNLYKGNKKIAGWKEQSFNATSVSQNDTYNDSAYLKIYGKSEQEVTTESPSPDYPSEIESVEEVNLTVSGKNLFDKNDENVLLPGMTIEQSGDGFTLTATTAGTRGATYTIPVQPNTNYTIKWLSSRSGATGGGVNLYGTNTQAANRFFYASSSLNQTHTFNTGEHSTLIVIFYVGDPAVIGNIVTFNQVQLEEGSTATAYEPFVALDTYNFPYILRSLPNGVKDELVIDNVAKTAKIIRKVGHFILSKSTPPLWSVVGWGSASVYRRLNNVIRMGNPVHTHPAYWGMPNCYMLCSHLPNKRGGAWSTDVENIFWHTATAEPHNRGFYTSFSRERMGIEEEDTDAQIISKYRDYVDGEYQAGRPVTMLYELATPSVENLDYEKIKTYYPATTVISDTEFEGKIRIIDRP